MQLGLNLGFSPSRRRFSSGGRSRTDSIQQTAIRFVGTEVGTEANSYPVQNWSNPSSPKAFNTSSSEVYGTAGYCQIRPIPHPVPLDVSINSPVSAGNDLGVTALTYPSPYVAPVFLGSLSGEAGSFVNLNGYSLFLAPNGTSVVRQGALSVPVSQGPYDSPAGSNASRFGVAVQFTTKDAAFFRLGIAVDGVGTGLYAPDYIGIYNPSTGTVFSTALTRNGTPDMAFFDLTAQANDAFTIALWQNEGTQSVAALSLLTVDLL